MSEATQELTDDQPTVTPTGTPAPAASRAGVTSPRDVQRDALRDLVALATECATTETEIEQRLATAILQSDKELESGLWSVEQRAKANDLAVRTKYDQKLAGIKQKFATEASALRQRDAETRERIARENDPPQRDLRNKYDQAVWLADSVLDSTVGQVREDLKKKRDEVAAEQARLAEMDARVQELIQLYNVKRLATETAPLPTTDNPDADYTAARDAANAATTKLNGLVSARLLIGGRPFAAVVLMAAIGATAAQLVSGQSELQIRRIEIGAGIGAGVAIVLGILLYVLSKASGRKLHAQFVASANAAHAAIERQLKVAMESHDRRTAEAQKQRADEVQAAKDKISPLMARLKAARDAATHAAAKDYDAQLGAITVKRDGAITDLDAWRDKALAEVQQKREREIQMTRAKHETRTRHSRELYSGSREDLARRLSEGLAQTQAPIEDRSGVLGQGAPNWAATDWSKWAPPRKFASVVRFGEFDVDLKKFADAVPRQGELKLQLPPAYSVPAMLAFPAQASLLVESDRAGRDEAIRVLQMTMVRLLTSLPPGRVRFTLIDPVGLGQNFAGFMHLADYDEALVGGRIWTDTDQINQRLADLTDHMETVIQKYLRNEFETIDDYNAQAGELAEPYRFLVIADFPVGFEADALRRLSSIASSGARCGVYTLIARDVRQNVGSNTYLDDVAIHSAVVTLDRGAAKFYWKDDVFRQFPLTLDPSPDEETLTDILQVVGRHAKEAKRVEVPFDTIAPKITDFWTRHSNEELTVPIGRTGATRLQMMRLGKGVAQHTLIAGKTGSGKSTLLHALVTNLAMWYSPDEVELYLIDFKKGVEFKTYATHALPHARAIAVESDREFGLSVLQRLDGELSRRGDLFRRVGVQDLNSYRAAEPTAVMPRTLLIIDEFQEFFSEDDKLAQDASLLLDRLVRQGRAFGVHVLLGSQTIGGSSGLPRSTIGQMAVRIALQTSEADSQLILGDGNSAARLLSRPGEAIYNDQGGLVEGNSPFQVAYLSDDGRDVYLERVNQKLAGYVEKHKRRPEPPVVFEGNALANIRTNEKLNALVNATAWPAANTQPQAWLGDPVAIKDPSAVTFRRQSGANLLVIGQQEESAIAIMAASLVGLAAQYKPGTATFYVLDGNPPDSPYANVFPMLKGLLPHDVRLVEYRAVPDAMNELATELAKRQAADEQANPVFVFIYGLQRYRMLRKSEDNFSFSMGSDDAEKKPQPDKQFGDLIREGPANGMHLLAWVDTPAAIDRTIDRNMVREFDNRILFQMSAADSSNLVDSPAANKLGFYRALAYSEEQGVMEKFRPYAMMDPEWLANLKRSFAARAK